MPPTLDDEVTFISGINPNGTLAYYSFAAWNPGTNPADYSGGYTNALKWGSPAAGTPGGAVSYYFDPASKWTAAEEQVFSDGLALWSAEANISFVQTSDPGAAQVTFTRGSDGKADTGPTPVLPIPDGAGVTDGSTLLQMASATVSIDTSVAGFGSIDGSFSTYGGYPWMTVIHEEGHVLGLGHAGPYNTTAVASQQYSTYDTRLWSVMSYLNNNSSNQYAPTNVTGWAGGYPVTPMIADILAAQRLYGLPTSTPLSGGQVFGFNTNITGDLQPFFDFTIDTRPVITLWDEGGNNTLDLSGYSTSSTVNLNPGTFSSVAGLTDNLAIAEGTAIDTFVGGSGADTVTTNNDGDAIYGDAGNDTLIAGAGNDILDGGAGTDTAVFSGSRSTYQLAQSGQNVIVSGPGGTDTLSNIELLQFASTTYTLTAAFRPTARNDFNGDGNPDLLMQYNDGSLAVWLMNGTNFAGGGLVGQPGASWHAIDTGDFDGDGKADILMQASDSRIAVWLMNGTSFAGGAQIGNAPGTSWHVKAAADFNGDGTADILMQNDDSSIAIWYVNGLNFAGGTLVGTAPGTAWQVEGTGDFNRDGQTDLVMQRSSGEIVVWTLNNGSFVSAGLVGNPGASWHVKAVADFDGDGKADLLLQNDDSRIAIWEMNGSSMVGAAVVDTPGTAWAVKGAYDFNGDGKADILLQRSSGEVAVWTMNGLARTGASIVGNPGAAWALVGPTGG